MVDTHFADAMADRLAIAKVVSFGLLDTGKNASLRHDVSQTVNPLSGLFGKEDRVHFPVL